MPTISIIIPVYNLKDYISKTLDSVFSQTFAFIEVIAVDDGSVDGSGEILDRYALTEPRLTVIHKSNGGVSSARLEGIKSARGEYIGFVDGDDLIDDDMFQKLYDNIIKYDADISHCGYRVIYPGGEIRYLYNTGKVIIQDNITGLCDLLRGEFIEPGLCNKLFSKNLFDEILAGDSVMDLSLRENEDFLMNYCLFLNSQRAVYYDFCPYQYIIRSNSASHSGVKPHILTDPVKIGRLLFDNTLFDKSVNAAAARYYAVKLITAATYRGDKNIYGKINSGCAAELKKFCREYKKTEKNKKRILQAYFAAYLPSVYSVIHRIYNKLKQR